ncbi:MAG: aromatic ring-hydroxylating oxygenase subunit alpha [Aestuariivirgaceae bacterium]
MPAWAYTNAELLDLERDVLFRRHWQLAGHVGNIPHAGDYFCLDVLGERALIVRGKDDAIRAFHNVCRHRGSRVVADDEGHCKTALVCPFHGWSFNLDGTFRSAPFPRSLPELDPVKHGLKPIDFEIWHGFIFVRFQNSDQPSMAELMAPHEAEVASYRLDQLAAAGPFWSEQIPANWKSVRDVDNEGYHVPIAHPALQDLYGKHYYDEPFNNGIARSFAPFDEDPGRLWSVRNYKKLLPDAEHLPASHKRAWLYLGIFPNAVLSFYPEGIDFYQEYPIGAGHTELRGAGYRWPDEDRQTRLARYLSGRINRDTGAEDVQLTVWSYEAAQSSGYDGIILSDLEYGVKSYHDELRRLMPVLRSRTEPAPGTLRSLNAAMAGHGLDH